MLFSKTRTTFANMVSATESRFDQAMAKHQNGELDVAAKEYESILASNPDHPGANHLFGITLHQRGKHESARSYIEKAISLCDHKAVYWNSYGAVLRSCGDNPAAEKALRQALIIKPDYPDCLSNLALCLQDQDKTAEAYDPLDRLLKIDPNRADAIKRLGELCLLLKRSDEAIEHFQKLISLNVSNIESWISLARAFAQAKNHADAARAYSKALELQPDNPHLHLSLGRAFSNQGDMLQARKAFDAAARLVPDRPSWRYRHLGNLPHIFESQASIDQALQQLSHQLDQAETAIVTFDWRRSHEDGFCPPFGVTHLGHCVRELKEKYASLYRPHFPQPRPEPRETDRLRVGFLVTEGRESGFLRNMKHIVPAIERERFEAVVLCPESGLKQCQQAITDDHVRWAPFPQRFEDSVRAISAAECDILYHRQIGTAVTNYFLPFARCAPIQCTGWGTHGTSGIDEIDYYLSSDLIELDGAQSNYTERLFLFHGTLPTCQSRIKRPKKAATRTEFGLPENGTLYFCPQRIEKLHPNFDRLLRGVLESNPNSVVVILKGRYPFAFEQLIRRLNQTLGKTLLRRIFFAASMPSRKYYSLLSLVDVVLDTPNYSTSLTGFDAISFGIPIVTQPGTRNVERYAQALYRKIGVTDLITDSEEGYIDLARQLGQEKDYRQSIHEKIEQNSASLFEDNAAITEHERFFEHAWKHRKT